MHSCSPGRHAMRRCGPCSRSRPPSPFFDSSLFFGDWMSDKIPLLVLNSLSSEHQSQIAAVYDLTYAPTTAERAAAIAAQGTKFRAVLTIGVIGLTPEEIAAMPKLELICAMG